MKSRDITDRNCIRFDADRDKLRGLRKEAYANDHLVALAAFMSAAGSETRLRMLYVLHRGGELCVCDLADIFEVTQPAVSRHLKILREKALVDARRDAQTIYYSVCDDNPFARMLTGFFDARDADHITLNLNPNRTA